MFDGADSGRSHFNQRMLTVEAIVEDKLRFCRKLRRARERPVTWT